MHFAMETKERMHKLRYEIVLTYLHTCVCITSFLLFLSMFVRKKHRKHFKL